ncbi:MAG: hypothetical protein COV34_01880 [Candidatus Zambryskibacteria bacterium CG10_big_fil_rev_8_21_14_0_10_42_12]|uniref:Right handed beta helix domain-containing protein n=1 Tax=Candidatus Zambryskibacteria bacterium CG10_big_fil_rev_8_21_14_0_10_42_12 TaxID=1975115 RepID=A0A2H0QXH9_9BACT|nr:MAG: hypothetical protein COV34_01880 [Candidatus Zambryskibacteria bacterium CG10_big_fil_rev_8_21_14_0_10_42_12]
MSMIKKGILLILVCVLLVIIVRSSTSKQTDSEVTLQHTNETATVQAESDDPLIVAKIPNAQFSTIQEALDNAKPGDTILVREGVYNEKIEWNTSGTKNAPITLKNFTDENPIIEPRGTTYKDFVALNGEWQIIDGFEIRNGWDGIVVNGSHNIVRNNYIHNNGDSCVVKEFCGQGILVVSAHDILIENNRIEQNGLTNYSPWHVHGIYLSDYYKKVCPIL